MRVRIESSEVLTLVEKALDKGIKQADKRGYIDFDDMEPYAYYRNERKVIDAPADQTQLTKQITLEITGFIDDSKDEPFFVYYASPFPHDPVYASEAFSGTSKAGTYGDCVQELDWSVGEIRQKLAEHGLTDNTLIIFTSDNGPWHEGNPGYRRGRKNTSFDGGQMVPFIAAWPGVIPAGREIEETAMNIDFMPTFLRMAGIALPTDREIDGTDMLPLLTGESQRATHDALYFIKGKEIVGLRTADNFKYATRQRSDNGGYWMMKQGPFLFDLNYDPNESYDVAAHFPEKAAVLRRRVEKQNKAMAKNARGWK